MNTPVQPRALPNSLEAEQGLLGSMMLAPLTVISLCIERMNDRFFYLPAHATIYNLLVELWNTQKPIDFISLTQHLRDRKLLDGVGGPAAVTHLFTFTPTAANASYYLEIVREKYLRRQIIVSGTDCVTNAFDEHNDITVVLDEAESTILAVRESTEERRDEPTIKEDVMLAIEVIERLYETRGAITGVETGFTEFDRYTNGLQPADMIVIAARPSMGKTSLVMNIAEYVAMVKRKPVAVFSLEMSRQQLVQRLISSRARVNLQKLRDGFLSERDFPNLSLAATKLADSPIHIDDRSKMSILELRAKARRWKKDHGIELMVVDYLQLLRSTSRRAQENRQIEIAEISQGIKSLAKELHIPIIVLAQLNRKPDDRTGTAKGKPRLSDLRESGSIEQDADLVALLVRAEVYEEDAELKAELAGQALVDIAKNRNGPVGEFRLTFIKEFTRFENRAEPQQATTAQLL
jgi:replicative DNA helicase